MKLRLTIKPLLIVAACATFFAGVSAARSQESSKTESNTPAPKTWLGATFSFDSPEAVKDYGARVERVIPGSPAARAGLEKGDIVLTLLGIAVRAVDDVQKAVRSLAPGTTVQFELYRSGNPLILSTTVGTAGVGGPATGGRPSERTESAESTRGGKTSKSDEPKAQPAGKRPGKSPEQPGSDEPQIAPAAKAPSQASTGVFINERELKPEQIEELRRGYGGIPPQGHYWYDSRSGLYGAWGHETAGYIRPGHNFGPLLTNASNGNTSVFINGRELNMIEVLYLQQSFGAVYQGHWWFDGQTGNIGIEGNPMPLANVFMMIQQAQQSRRGGNTGGGYRWRDGRGSVLSSEGGTTMMTTPGYSVCVGNNC